MSSLADDVRVARRTIWDWMKKGKIDWCVIPSGQRRVYADSLRRHKPLP